MMFSVVIPLFVTGMLLSGFFSGSETGLYRVTRVRLAMEGMSGDPVSSGLLWLVNNPALFVATTLIGNNLANYLVSHSIVLGTQLMIGGHNAFAELVAPLIVAPFVFVYGELLPKNLYYLAPNQLLRGGGPLFLLFGILFAPVSFLLWILGRVLQRFVGESPEFVRLRLARNEVRQLLEEGHQAGILEPAQRRMVEAVFEQGSESISRYCTPPTRMSMVSDQDERASLLRTARRQHSPELLVYSGNSKKLIGYVRVVDLYLNRQDWNDSIHELFTLDHTDSLISAAMKLQDHNAEIARVVDGAGKSMGIVTLRQLTDPLYHQR